MSFTTHLFKSFLAMLFLTVFLGFIYPLIMTGLGELIFSHKVHGSLIQNAQGQVVGSVLIGQNFQNPKYFFGRPSAASPAYNALSSGGSNLSVTNPQLFSVFKTRIAALQKADPNQKQLIPIDLITASGSGLDPDISLASAYYQAPRIAKLRNLPLEKINGLIDQNKVPRQWGVLGEPHVNVLKLNLALDSLGK
jgi:potassium-transporting ATPase KdpC subunit